MNKKVVYILLVAFLAITTIWINVKTVSAEPVNKVNGLINVSIVTMPEIGTWNSGGSSTWLIFKYMSNFLPLRINTISREELITKLANSNDIPDILVMTDITNIDTPKLDAVKSYVHNGGKLIVVGTTAKNNEIGTIEKTHRLGDVLGLNLQSWSTSVNTRYISLQGPEWYLFNKEIYDNFMARGEGVFLVLPTHGGMMKDYAIDVNANPNSQIIMRLHDIKDGNDSNNVYIDGVIKHSYGKGTTFFFPVGFENFHGWQEIDNNADHWKYTGMYLMFMFYYSAVLDFYKDISLPVISTAPNGRSGTVTIEIDVEGDYGKPSPYLYGVSDSEVYSKQAYESMSKIWKPNVLDNPRLNWTKGKWEFAILTKLLDGKNGNFTSNTKNLIYLLKDYGVIGAHSYNHLVEWNNGQLRWNISNWEINNTFRMWQLLVDNKLAEYPVFWWAPMITVPNTYDDVKPYVDNGKTTVFWWSNVRTPIQLIPFPLVNKNYVRNRLDGWVPFYTMPQAANWIHGISDDWEPQTLELSKYGISPILVYVWNDAEYDFAIQGMAERELLEMKYYMDKGKLEFLTGYEFNDWWKTRSKVNFNNLIIDSDSIIFDINTPETIRGLTVRLQNLSNRHITNILIDEIECDKCFNDDTMILPLLSSGEHKIQAKSGLGTIPPTVSETTSSIPEITPTKTPAGKKTPGFTIVIGIISILIIYKFGRNKDDNDI